MNVSEHTLTSCHKEWVTLPGKKYWSGIDYDLTCNYAITFHSGIITIRSLTITLITVAVNSSLTNTKIPVSHHSCCPQGRPTSIMSERLSSAAVMYTERPWSRLMMTHRVSKSAQQPLSLLQNVHRDVWSDRRAICMINSEHLHPSSHRGMNEPQICLSWEEEEGQQELLLWIMRMKAQYTAGIFATDNG